MSCEVVFFAFIAFVSCVFAICESMERHKTDGQNRRYKDAFFKSESRVLQLQNEVNRLKRYEPKDKRIVTLLRFYRPLFLTANEIAIRIDEKNGSAISSSLEKLVKKGEIIKTFDKGVTKYSINNMETSEKEDNALRDALSGE